MLASPAVESWGLLFLALGMAFFLEGLPYFISPPGVRRYIEMLSKMSDGGLRLIGLAMMIVGLVVAFFATR